MKIKYLFTTILFLLITIIFMPLKHGDTATLYPYGIVKEISSDRFWIVDKYQDQYIIELGWSCNSYWLDEGDIIYIDSLYPGYGDDVYYGSEQCDLYDVEEVDLEPFYIENVIDSKDQIIVQDAGGDRFLVEYGMGCSSMWRFEDKYIHIDIGGSFLDGISDRVYLLDSDQDCRVWDVDELSSNNFLYIPGNYNICPDVINGYLGTDGECYCKDGYKWSNENNKCIPLELSDVCIDAENGFLGYDGKCYCSNGYEWNVVENKCMPINFPKSTVTNPCPEGATYDAINNKCNCPTGFDWGYGATKCIPMTTSNPTSDTGTLDILPITNAGNYNSEKFDSKLVSRLLGNILLQVEEHGEAWYLNPTDRQRYYMKDGSVAYEMMRSFGLGITDNDLSKMPISNTTEEIKNSSSICTTNAIANRLKGKILLQVQQNGEAYYVYPNNCRMIYMKDGNAAYQIMRYLGLGITNGDLEKIPSN
jgi:hypothetical protein